MSKYIVDFKDNTTEEVIQQYLLTSGASIVKTFSSFKNIYLVESPTQPAITDIVEHVIADEENPITLLGEIIQVNNQIGTIGPSDASSTFSVSDSKQWWKVYSLRDLDENATSVTIPVKGKGTIIYLVDSGIKKDHSEFADASISDLFSICPDYEDRSGHGTALASVMVGKTCGVADATVKNVKLFDSVVSTYQSNMIAAFDAILTDFYANPIKIGVVNCSWAIARNTYIESKLQALIDAGLVVTVAAGNNGTVIENVTPAAMENVVVVGAYNSDFKPCDFSNFSDSSISVTAGATNSGKLSGWAPGQDIWSATLDGNYGNASGTSIATAIHSAIIAYTFSEYLCDNNMTGFYMQQPNKTNLTFGTFGKKGILDFADEKYSSSPNSISLLKNNLSKSYEKLARGEYFSIKTEVGKIYASTIYDPTKVETVEITSPLPAGFNINDRGLLVGAASSIPDPNFMQYSILTKLNNLDKTVTEMTLHFMIKSQNFDISLIDDPVLRYQLQDEPSYVDCYPGGFYFPFPPVNVFCFDTCAEHGFLGCYFTTYKGVGDYCQCA